MRFVLNSRLDNMGSRVCIHDLQARLAEAGFDATLNDWGNYGRYDVAVFMAADHEMEAARAQNPRIKVVLADPKQSSAQAIEAAIRADLLLVSSVEQREAFLRLNRNILVHFMLPRMRAVDRLHVNGDEFVIGYHGNRVHLEAMCQHVTPALEALGRERPCRFVAMYNIEGLGRAKIGLPDSSIVPTEHVQWSWDNYYSRLSVADVGIVPNLLPVADKLATLRHAEVPGLNVNYEPFDYLLRFKASSNPGRLQVFARLGIPVIVDFTPSSVQLIDEGRTGLLAGSPTGWYEALRRFAIDPALRQRCAQGLRQRLDECFDAQVGAFVTACQSAVRHGGQTVENQSEVETELAAYVPPQSRPASIFRRLARRLAGGAAR